MKDLLAMHLKPSTAILGGVGLLAIWLVAAAGTRPADDRGASSALNAAAVPDPVAEDLRVQAERLRYRFAPTATPRLPVRNPFEFATPTQPRPSLAVPELVTPPAIPLPAPRPALKLVAIGQTGDQRTAIISVSDQVLLVRVGDQILERYRVSAIGADAIEIFDTFDNTASRFGLQ